MCWYIPKHIYHSALCVLRIKYRSPLWQLHYLLVHMLLIPPIINKYQAIVDKVPGLFYKWNYIVSQPLLACCPASTKLILVPYPSESFMSSNRVGDGLSFLYLHGMTSTTSLDRSVETVDMRAVCISIYFAFFFIPRLLFSRLIDSDEQMDHYHCCLALFALNIYTQSPFGFAIVVIIGLGQGNVWYIWNYVVS